MGTTTVKKNRKDKWKKRENVKRIT